MKDGPGLPADSHPVSESLRLCSGPLVALVLVWMWPFPVAVGADVFKWVDDEGRVHYGDSPPQEREVQTIPTPPPPSGSAVLQSRSRLDGLRGRETEAERRKAREQERRTAAREEEQRKGRCRRARRGLAALEIERPVFHLDERGNRVYLEDDERAAELKRFRKSIKSDCR